MLVFNVTEMAAKHLCRRYKKGVDNAFFNVPTSSIEEDVQSQSGHSREQIHFVVDVIKIGDDYNFIVVEYETHWCHILHQVKENDVGVFVNRFYTRWFNSIGFMAEHYGLFCGSEMQAGIDNFFSCHDEMYFYIRKDKSLNDIIKRIYNKYRNAYCLAECYPENEEVACGYDVSINKCSNNKDRGENSNAAEGMMILFLRDYFGWTAKKLSSARAIIRDEENHHDDSILINKDIFTVENFDNRSLH